MARGGTIRSLAGAGVLALLLAGCGGGDGDDDTADESPTTEAEAAAETTDAADPAEDEPAEPTETSTEPETTTTVPGGLSEEDAQAIPDQVDITLEDAVEYDPTFVAQELDGEDEALLDGCAPDAAAIEPIAEGEGTQYEADAAYAASGTSVMASEEEAIAVVDAFEADGVIDCLADGIRENFDRDDLTVDIASYPGGTRFGDQWANIGGSVTSAETGVSAGFELHVLRTGPIVTVLLYLDRESGEATAYVTDGLLTLIDERQTAALG